MCTGMKFWSCDIRPFNYDIDLGNLVDAAVSKILMATWPMCACELSMRGRCAWVWNVGPVTFGHDSCGPPVSMVVMEMKPVCIYGLPMKGRCAGPGIVML